MTTWVVLLRGINVGGGNRLPMAELVALLEGLGLRDVRTVIASGNAIVRADDGVDPESIAARIAEEIHAGHGFAPRVMLVSPAALRAAVVANPFAMAAAEPRTLHLLFAERPPERPDLAGLERERGPGEGFVLDGSVLYLHLPDGIGRSRLGERAERLLGVPATGRNWNTVTRLAALVAEEG